MLKNRYFKFGAILVLLLTLAFTLMFFYRNKAKEINKDGSVTMDETGQDERNQIDHRSAKKHRFIVPDGNWMNLLEGTGYEPMALESPSKRWIEFVFLKQENGRLKKDGIYRWVINPITPDGSFAEKGSSSAAGSVDKIFRLRFGLAKNKNKDGVFLSNQLHRFEFKKKLNGRWYKQRFKTPRIGSMKRGEVKRYPILLNSYKPKSQKKHGTDTQPRNDTKKYSIDFQLKNITEPKNKDSELWVSYVKNGDELFEKKYFINNIQGKSINFKVNHEASSRKDLLGGNLFIYALSGNMGNDWYCAKWHLLCLKKNLQERQLNFEKNNAFYRDERKVVEAIINLNDYINKKLNHENHALDKLYLVSPSANRFSFAEDPVNTVTKSGACVKDSSRVRISAPKGKYHLMYKTKNNTEKKMAKRNLEWPP